jgi:hypothetical protein
MMERWDAVDIGGVLKIYFCCDLKKWSTNSSDGVQSSISGEHLAHPGSADIVRVRWVSEMIYRHSKSHTWNSQQQSKFGSDLSKSSIHKTVRRPIALPKPSDRLEPMTSWIETIPKSMVNPLTIGKSPTTCSSKQISSRHASPSSFPCSLQFEPFSISPFQNINLLFFPPLPAFCLSLSFDIAADRPTFKTRTSNINH